MSDRHIIPANDVAHYGVARRSGRYPWGSGKDPYTRATNFINEEASLRKQGLTEVEVANYFGINTKELRARKADTKGYVKQKNIATARNLREKGMSPAAIAQRMGLPDSTVRALLKPDADAKAAKTESVRDVLAEAVDQIGYVDYGKGVSNLLGCSTTTLNTAAEMLHQEGYVTHQVQVKQVGSANQKTIVKVLAKPGTTRADVYKNIDQVRVPSVTVDPEGKFTGKFQKPTNIDPKRVKVRYAEDGGGDMDGVIELRRGVPDISLGSSHYAQVRIAVGNSHYIKGMAIHSDDLPPGVDILVHSPKKKSTPMMGPKENTVLKPFDNTGDPNNPFGAYIKKQFEYKDPKTGKKKLSALNLLNEEGDWDKWSKTLSSQMLSKQLPSEAKRQLEKTRAKAEDRLSEIMSLTNPTIRRKLLLAHAESMDGKSVDLKAEAYPRQAAQVILPIPKIKKNEIYAPNFKDGERVALVRYPHGGTFEIPELVVNNKSREGIRIMGKKALDAVGIHPSVAEKLSGADFDGDTVVVIPNNAGRVKSSPTLKGMKDFEPKRAYPYREGMKLLTKGKMTQREMGNISNLITDMTLKGATESELARAVRHSMVVIDAAKHRLDYQQSAIDHGIPDLKQKYQGSARGGASTIISRAKGDIRVAERRLRRASEGGFIDKKTGELVYTPTGGTHKKREIDAKGNVNWIDTPNETIIPRLSYVKDAHQISSGTPMEKIYADHSNALKAMANRARKESLAIKDTPYSPEAYRKYKPQVESLKAKLDLAHRNKPLERQAQILANSRVKMHLEANPSLKEDKDAIKKIQRRALADARASVGGSKYNMQIDPPEWEAIQAGAIRKNRLEEIMEVTDADHLSALAMPKAAVRLTGAKRSRAESLLRTHTIAEVAEAMGVSTATVRDLVGESNE